MIKVAVFGVNGRMGKAVAAEVLATPDMQLVAAIVRDGNPEIGNLFENSNIQITSKLDVDADVLIDFTLPQGVMDHLQYAKPMVIGTTGFTDTQLREIAAAAKYVPIVLSSNMSVGVNCCYKLLEKTTKILDNKWSAQIVDVHHQHKKDQPSGTAKEMARIIADREVAIYSERHGEVVGDHSVTFADEFEEIVITHRAKDRRIFAKGAITAARWVWDRKPQIYNMLDVIG